ncbi:unnamed protein product [Notodromas monacha]|uniref:Uncharacterized protein n=1 Tax=Notodromas monacha TaxID=399045 RepID=A0A7R9GGH3_9CRUS|nr:unnamed protein product [Notodromas monacha]CAG0921708.1 unnamed protein product [Notodromas monacha]
MHSRGAAALKDKFGGGHINASLHREKDPKSNAVKSVFRKEFRDSQGRLRGFQQAHSVVHAVNTSAVNGSMPFLLPPGGRHLDENGFNIGNIMDKIREFHQSLFGAGAGGDGGGGPIFGGMGADGNGTGIAFALVCSLVMAQCAPTRNTAIETHINDILTLSDEKPGSNNKSNNTSCCSSDPKGSSNSSSNKSTNFDDFREDKGSAKKSGPTVDQILQLKRLLEKKGIKFSVAQSANAKQG